MFGVETDSFLPDQQSDGRDLARQGKACHRGVHPSGNQSGIELLERSGNGSGPGCGTLEDIFQVVIVVDVESANGQKLLGTFQLAFYESIFPAGVSLQR